MSIENRRTKTVYRVIEQLAEQGKRSFRPGDVTAVLRERGQPLGAWEVRGELSILEAEGLIELDEETGAWSMRAGAGKEAAG